MTFRRQMKQATLALLALSSLASIESVYAEGTIAGTTITNQATVTYQVGSIDQTPITSAAAFVVDNRIDLTVSETGAATTIVNPGQLNRVTTFVVQNDGNAPQGFILGADNQATNTASPFAGGSSDNQDVGNIRWFVEAGAVAGGNPTNYDPTDVALNISSLAPDASIRVYVVADIPVAAANGQFANVLLTAAVANNNTTTPAQETGVGVADDPTTVEVVFGDAGEDATESAADQYEIQSAALTMTKTSRVLSDPFNQVSANAKAIPRAIVEYTITVTNNSTTTDALNVVVTDPIPANVDYEPTSIRLNNGAPFTDGDDLDAGRYEAGPTEQIVVEVGTIAQDGGAATVTFQVEIQ
jgi:uncharacterized repeat protein (TIGR01451 family)